MRNVFLFVVLLSASKFILACNPTWGPISISETGLAGKVTWPNQCGSAHLRLVIQHPERGALVAWPKIEQTGSEVSWRQDFKGWLPPGAVGGVYTLQMDINGAAGKNEIAVPCPAPTGRISAVDAAKSTIQFAVTGADACQGDITLKSDFVAADGQPIKSSSTKIPVTSGSEREVTLPLVESTALADVRMFWNMTALAGQSASGQALYRSPCRVNDLNAVLDSGHIRFDALLPECAYPMDIRYKIVRDGAAIEDGSTVLNKPPFDVVPKMPLFAGQYEISGSLQGLGIGNRSWALKKKIDCVQPEITNLERTINEGVVLVKATYNTIDPCNDKGRAELIIRDNQNNPIWTDTQDIKERRGTLTFVPALSIKGAFTAELSISSRKSKSSSSQIPFTMDCTTPKAIVFAPLFEGTGYTALVESKDCTTPFAAALESRDRTGKPMQSVTSQITERGWLDLRGGDKPATVILRIGAASAPALAKSIEPAASANNPQIEFKGIGNKSELSTWAQLRITATDPVGLIRPAIRSDTPIGTSDTNISGNLKTELKDGALSLAFTTEQTEINEKFTHFFVSDGKTFFLVPIVKKGFSISNGHHVAAYLGVTDASTLTPGILSVQGLTGIDCCTTTFEYTKSVTVDDTHANSILIESGSQRWDVPLRYDSGAFIAAGYLPRANGNYKLTARITNAVGEQGRIERNFEYASTMRTISIGVTETQAQYVSLWPEIDTAQHHKFVVRKISGDGTIRLNDVPITGDREIDISDHKGGALTATISSNGKNGDAEWLLSEISTGREVKLQTWTIHPTFQLSQRHSDQSGWINVAANLTDSRCGPIVLLGDGAAPTQSQDIHCAIRVTGSTVNVINNTGSRINLMVKDDENVHLELGVVGISNSFHAEHLLSLKEIPNKAPFKWHFLNTFGAIQDSTNWTTQADTDSLGQLVVTATASDEPSEVNINGSAVTGSKQLDGSFAYPIHGSMVSGERRALQVSVRAQGLSETISATVVAIGETPQWHAEDAPLISGHKNSLRARINAYNAKKHGKTTSAFARLNSQSLTTHVIHDDEIEIELPELKPGPYSLDLTFENSSSNAPAIQSLPFEVLNGSPIEGKLSEVNGEGSAPLTSLLWISTGGRDSDVGTVEWRSSEDGTSYSTVEIQDGQLANEFHISKPGKRWYKAVVINKHTGATKETNAVEINSLISNDWRIVGPYGGLVGQQLNFNIQGASPSARFVWCLASNHQIPCAEGTSFQHAFNAEGTATLYVTCNDSGSSARKAVRLEIRDAKRIATVIGAPRYVVPGMRYRLHAVYTNLFPEIPVDVKQDFHWDFPAGVSDHKDSINIDIPKDFSDPVYTVHLTTKSQLGDSTVEKSVAESIPVLYAKNRLATAKLSVVSSLGNPGTTVYYVNARDADDAPLFPSTRLKWTSSRKFSVIASGHSDAIIVMNNTAPTPLFADLSSPSADDSAQIETSLAPATSGSIFVDVKTDFERSFHSTPIKVKIQPMVTGLQSDDRIARAYVYVDGRIVKRSDGKETEQTISGAGEHSIEVLIATARGLLGRNSLSFTLQENQAPQCSIVPLQDGRNTIGGRASCTDIDSQVVDYRWFIDGKLFQQGTPNILFPTDRPITKVTLIVRDSEGVSSTTKMAMPDSPTDSNDSQRT